MLRDGTPPPDELRVAWACQRWSTLPDAGGWFDQDYQLTMTMTALLNIYDACSQWRNLTGERIHLMTEQTRRILRRLLDIGVQFN